MSTGKFTFKHTDAKRLIRAAKDEGLKVTGLTVDRDGNIRVETDSSVSAGDAAQPNPWDEVLPDESPPVRSSVDR